MNEPCPSQSCAAELLQGLQMAWASLMDGRVLPQAELEPILRAAGEAMEFQHFCTWPTATRLELRWKLKELYYLLQYSERNLQLLTALVPGRDSLKTFVGAPLYGGRKSWQRSIPRGE